MASANQPPGPAPWARSRIPALVGTGAFIILAGTIVPKLLTQESSDAAALAGRPAASAKDTPAPTAEPAAGSGIFPFDAMGPIERLLIVTSIVLLAGVAGIWVHRRRRLAPTTQLPAILNVTAALPLRQNCCAYLVEIGGRQFLAGVDATGIRSVLPLPPRPADPPPPIVGPGQFRMPLLGGVR